MDQSQDLLAKDFYKYVRLYDAPDFVKRASIDDICGGPELPHHIFGDPVKRLYPCHTPAAAWTSLAYFLTKDAAERPRSVFPVRDRILSCGRVLGIETELEQLEQKVAGDRLPTEAELPDDDFALVIQGPGGKERHYLLRNGPEVKAAADYLLQYRDHFPFALRQQFADRVLHKQAQLGVGLPEATQYELEKQAGHGAGTSKDAAEMILNRVRAVKGDPRANRGLQCEMLKLAQIIAQRPSQLREPGVRYKIAATVDAFDRANRLTEHSAALPRVEDVLFGLTREKMAACVREHVELPTGMIYKMADVERVPLQEIGGLFGDDFQEAMTSDGLHVDGEKATEVLPTLPLPDAHLFDRLLHQTGIQPVAKEASARSTAISNQFLASIRQAAQAR